MKKAKPVFIDSEINTWNMDPNYLEDAINYYIKKRIQPKAIIPVHLYGTPANMNEITALSLKYEIPIIEDAAEALGSRYNNDYCGNLGDIGILSFNGNKIITTSGGGAFISNNISYIKSAKHLSNAAKENEHYYLHNDIGFNYRMSNVLAGIGRGQLKSIGQKVEAKRAIYEKYKSILNKVDGIHFCNEERNAYCNRWLTTLYFDDTILNKISLENIKLNFDKLNIETRFLWNPMHLQPVFKTADYFGGNVAESLFNSGLCLPSGVDLDLEKIEEISCLLKAMIYA